MLFSSLSRAVVLVAPIVEAVVRSPGTSRIYGSAMLYMEYPECPQDLPFDHWPRSGVTGYHREAYTSLSQLCNWIPIREAARRGNKDAALPNLGCYCTKSGIVSCELQLSRKAPDLSEYCKQKCSCLKKSNLKPPSGREMEDRMETDSIDWRSNLGFLPKYQESKTDKVKPGGGFCGLGACTSFSNCRQAARQPGCEGILCLAQVDLATRGFLGIGVCGVPALGGRRDLAFENNCMCNASFVSKSCCGAKDGMVWEKGSRPIQIAELEA